MTDWIEEVAQALGHNAIDLSADRRTLVAQDVFSATAPVLAVVAPRSTEQVVAVVQVAGRHGLHVVPRGGGVSYTSGYLSTDPGTAIVLDFTQMNRIIEIAAEDMYVTVEPGCTWQALHAALAPHGLRAAFWGTISGARATIGGSVSQNAFFWGSGQAGSVADTVLAVEVVTGSGEIVRTGMLGVAGARPFFRHFGPDLTGAFTSDAGALGIKTRIVLRLARLPGATGALSFALPDADTLSGLLSEIAREGLTAQQMGFDTALKSARVASDGLFADLGHLFHLVRGARSLPSGLSDAFRTIRAGRGEAEGAFSAHLFLEGADPRAVTATAGRVRAIAATYRAVEAEPTIPKMLQARPFGPLNGMLGPKGERWVPVHCVVPHAIGSRAYRTIADVLHVHEGALKQHGIETGFLFTTVGVNGFVIEPMFLWPDVLHPLHRDVIDAGRLARYPARADSAEARATVATVRAAITTAVDALGAAHIQFGRYYPYRRRIDPGVAAMLDALRARFDPQGTLNPGVLH